MMVSDSSKNNTQVNLEAEPCLNPLHCTVLIPTQQPSRDLKDTEPLLTQDRKLCVRN